MKAKTKTSAAETSRQYAVRLPPELVERIEAHRRRLDKHRPQGAEGMTFGAALRNLVIEGLRVHGEFVAEPRRG